MALDPSVVANATPWGSFANAAAQVLGTPTSSGVSGASRAGGAVTRGDFIVGAGAGGGSTNTLVLIGVAVVVLLVLLKR